ncbi:hypothetical protein BS78_01G413500 [Paspalum vaginatum]|nr:hypothetical protein BS78_01G413500 [Paspalum vaginatum]
MSLASGEHLALCHHRCKVNSRGRRNGLEWSDFRGKSRFVWSGYGLDQRPLPGLAGWKAAQRAGGPSGWSAREASLQLQVGSKAGSEGGPEEAGNKEAARDGR